MAETAEDTVQAFNRMWGASFVVFSDAASQDLAETGLVRVYPDAPRITMTSLLISPTETVSGTVGVPLQVMDLLYDSVRVVAYPGQAKGAEQVYQMTRGMNEAFLEKMVGGELVGREAKSAAGVLLAAAAQGIPLIYVDMKHLEPLANASLSDEAKARIVQAAQQGYGVLVPEHAVAWNGELTTAWWQVDLESGEAIGVSKDGTHQFLVTLPAEARLLAITLEIMRVYIGILTIREEAWRFAANRTWDYFWRGVGNLSGRDRTVTQIYQDAFKSTKMYMGIGGRIEFIIDCWKRYPDDQNICRFAW